MSVGLRGRFTLWFALAALVPIAVAALVTREVVSDSFRNEYAAEREQAEQAARAGVAALSADVAATVEGLASPEQTDVRGLLFELSKLPGSLPAEARMRLKARDAGIMAGLGLDLMVFVEDTGTIVSAPHFRAAVDELDEHYRERARDTGGAPYFAFEPMLIDGETRRVLIAEAARVVRDGGRSITVVGGRAVRPTVLDRIRRGGRIDARLVAADGEVIFPGTGTFEAEHGERIEVPLAGPDGAPIASVQVALSDARLEALLERVTLAAALMGLGALAATILLGLVVSRRMTRDLDALVAGVQAASRGDLDHRVPSRSNDEIGEVAEAVNTMMGDLKAANERLAVAQRIAAWQEIARRLAHEIKNPLTPIQMSVETMRRTRAKAHPSFGEVFDESTATILEEVARLKRIVSEFSEFARMPKPSRAECQLNDVVAAQTSLYKGTCDIAEALDPALPPIHADRDQLAQVVLNLIENARDATAALGEGARIEVRTRRDGDGVELIVDDNGPGLSPEIKDKLFTPYFTTKHAAGGTGLGLPIVHRIVSDHGGRVAIGDAPIGGARFAIRLPGHAEVERRERL